jgi:predicted Rossmann-fold nucleotide-binding protein
VILYGSEYWRKLWEWIEEVALKEGKVSEKDLKLLHITDSPEEVVKMVMDSQSALREIETDITDEYRQVEKR